FIRIMEPPHTPDVIVWLDGPRGRIVGMQFIEEATDADQAMTQEIDALRQMMEKPAGGKPVLPAKLEVLSAELAHLLQEALSPLGVVVDSVEEEGAPYLLEAIDRILEDFFQEMKGSSPS